MNGTISRRMARDTLFLLIAIALAVPLSVVANLLTPRLRDWWSATSKKRLLNRIEELERVLKIANPPFQEVLLGALVKLAFGLINLVILLAGIAVTVVQPQVIPTPWGPRANAVISLVVIFVVYMLAAVQFIGMYRDVRSYLQRIPNSHARNQLQLRIERLRQKLKT